MAAKLYGSLNNRFDENAFYGIGIGEVKVGMKVTQYLYSDSHVYEIIEILKQDKNKQKFECIIRRMKAIRTDNNGMSDCQSYKFESDPNGCLGLLKLSGYKYKRLKAYRCLDSQKKIFSKNATPDGWGVNIAQEYYDYSF